MRLALATVAITTVLACSVLCTPTAFAGSPGNQSKLAKAGSAMNPMNWTMPTWKTPQWNFLSKPEPPRIKKKQESVFSTVSRKTSSGWNKTKNALSPSNLFASKPKAAPPKKSSPGFFSSMFAPKPEPKEVSTVNDFLSLPRSGNE